MSSSIGMTYMSSTICWNMYGIHPERSKTPPTAQAVVQEFPTKRGAAGRIEAPSDAHPRREAFHAQRRRLCTEPLDGTATSRSFRALDRKVNDTTERSIAVRILLPVDDMRVARDRRRMASTDLSIRSRRQAYLYSSPAAERQPCSRPIPDGNDRGRPERIGMAPRPKRFGMEGDRKLG